MYSSEEAAENDLQYISVIGSIFYNDMHTRPEIAVATSMIARIAESLAMKDQKAAVKVVNNPNFTESIGLKLKTFKGKKISAYVDENRTVGQGSGRRLRSGNVIL